jgi:hypothetical protein
MRIITIAAFLIFIAVGCSKESQFDVKEGDLVTIDELADDFVVPEVIWKSMTSDESSEGEKKEEAKPKAEEHGNKEAKGEEKKEGGGEGKTKEKTILYTSIKVFMKEKNSGVLKKPLMAYEFSRGGGDFDLASVMGQHSGTFYLGFEFPEFENVLQKKVFFISENRQRKVDGEILGSGCHKVLDISTQFFKQIADQGIKINTTRDRHDSIMGGHMIFLAETDKNWLMTQVTFYDSSRPDLFCKGFRTPQVEVH